MCVNTNGGTIGRFERFDGLPDKVGIARSIEQVHVATLMLDMDDLRLDRVVMKDLFRVKVADAGPIVDAVQSRGGPTREQQLIEQGCFARVAMAAKSNVAATSNSCSHRGPFQIGEVGPHRFDFQLSKT